MSIANDKARKIWNDVFGADTLWAQDCFGTWIYREDHGDYETTRLRPGGTGKRYSYGWDVDHIRPKADFENESDADMNNNYEPMHRKNNESKSDDYTHFEIDGRKYKVVKCEICSNHGLLGYGIFDIQKNKRIDWKARTDQYYTSN